MENNSGMILSLLKSLYCERLTSNSENKELIKSFTNKRNRGLAESLKNSAWEEDGQGHIAYYLIKDKNGHILFFFSLKCGVLFELLDKKELEE